MQMDEAISQCNKYINKYILRGRGFVWYACFRYGDAYLHITGEPDERFVDEYQYFVFTKSTKFLISIRELLRSGKTEDVLIILRSMFEGYLASRYIDESYEPQVLNDFLFIPQLIAQRKIIYDGKVVIERENKSEIPFNQRDPSKMRLGKDKDYFYDFYDSLCNYAHCNYSIFPCYLADNGTFTCEKETNPLLTRVMVLFVYTKLFENIVTIEGEDFLDLRTEKECYKLLKEATIFLYNILGCFGDYNSKANERLNKHMKNMFKN